MQNLTEKDATNEQSGLVISYFGNSVAVEDQSGQVFQCFLRRNQELPVVGDHVLWKPDVNKTGIISAIEPRSSLLARGDKRGKMRAIAANVDAIVIVMAPAPIFSEYLIDRYLVAAELLQIPAILVLNKMDLLDKTQLAAAKGRLAFYKKIPYDVVFSTVLTSSGLHDLASILKNKNAVLVGPSGVGKSSIITALGNTEVIRVGNVTAKGAGKHTTTATRLYHLPQGGHLIDSPGVREFTLWPVNEQELLCGFKEFKPYLTGCRFRDCHHLAEPGCAVQQAAADGKISPLRYASFKELMKAFCVTNKR